MTEDLEAKLTKLKASLEITQREIAALTKEKQRLDALGPDYVLAEYLHSKTCRLNHTDACGWSYETWGQGEQWTKIRYLNWARRIREELQKLKTQPTTATPLDLAKIVLENRV